MVENVTPKDQSLAARTREELETAAGHAADAARAAARSKVESATNEALNRAEAETTRAAHAAEAAAREFEHGSLQRQAATQIASGLEQFAGMIRETDLDLVAARMTRFARENPALFLGGAALLGFAAARFLKSSDPAPRIDPMDRHDPWTGHVSGYRAGAMGADDGGRQ